MPANIEIKARAHDFDAIRRRAAALSDIPCEVIHQHDTFFPVANGRLKLRRLAPDHALLIYYLRTDQEGPKRSDYQLTATNDPQGLQQVLTQAYGLRGVVKKTRYFYRSGQTRIHLDDVEGLGQFVELEVALRPDQSDAEGQKIAEGLMEKLGVQASDLLEGAYMDLLEK